MLGDVFCHCIILVMIGDGRWWFILVDKGYVFMAEQMLDHGKQQEPLLLGVSTWLLGLLSSFLLSHHA